MPFWSQNVFQRLHIYNEKLRSFFPSRQMLHHYLCMLDDDSHRRNWDCGVYCTGADQGRGKGGRCISRDIRDGWALLKLDFIFHFATTDKNRTTSPRRWGLFKRAAGPKSSPIRPWKIGFTFLRLFRRYFRFGGVYRRICSSRTFFLDSPLTLQTAGLQAGQTGNRGLVSCRYYFRPLWPGLISGGARG